jgi:uncharacterized protein with HEPN domain
MGEVELLLKRLEFYFEIGEGHLQKLEKAVDALSPYYPFSPDVLERLGEGEWDKLDVLAFRFAKLQDLIGEKIFRNLLKVMGVNTNRPFLEILAELEREGIVEVKRWVELRFIRNRLAHDYPEQTKEVAGNINFLIENVGYLKEVFRNSQKLFEKIKKRLKGGK